MTHPRPPSTPESTEDLRAFLALHDASCPECGRALQVGIATEHAGPWGWRLAVVVTGSMLVAGSINATTDIARCLNWYGRGLPPHTEAWLNWAVTLGGAGVTLVAGLALALLLRRPRVISPRWLRRAFALALLYGIAWIGTAIYWSVRWWFG